MRGRPLAAAALLLACAAPALLADAAVTCPPTSPGYATTSHALPDGRTFRLHAPTGPAAPEPLVVALHGASQTGAIMEAATCLTPFAEGRWALAYGEGLYGSWNAGPEAPSPQACCGGARDNHVDDVAYIAAVIAAAETLTPVDPARVYVVGGSNGGMMAYKAGCALPEVAAVGSVSGSLLVPCPRGVDAIEIHGTSDTTVPQSGPGTGGAQGTTFLPLVSIPMRMPRDAVWTLLAYNGGHGWPGWADGSLDAFFAYVAQNPR